MNKLSLAILLLITLAGTVHGVECDPVCSGETPNCDTTVGTCKECTDDSHCTTEGESCLDNGTCGVPNIACDPVCSGETPNCDTTVGTCKECIDNSHCTTDGETCIGGTCGIACSPACSGDTANCDITNGTCKECTENSHCTTQGESCLDDGTCGIPCSPACDGETPNCDTTVGQCKECLENSHCTNDGEICLINNTCGAAECPNNDTGCTETTKPYCNTNICVACSEHADPNTYCDGKNPGNVCLGTGACGAPLACDPACSGETPNCDAGAGQCVQCTEDSHCTTVGQKCSAEKTCVFSCDNCEGATPFCNGAKDACVACNDDVEATKCTGNTVCNSTTGACTFSCTTCSGNTPFCNAERTACIACDDNVAATKCPGKGDSCNSETGACELDCAKCAGATPFCNTEKTACVACDDDVEATRCTEDNETCSDNGRCEFDCDTCSGTKPFCNANRTACVACDQPSADSCTGNAPVCLADGSCGGCDDDSFTCPTQNPVCDTDSKNCTRCDMDNAKTLCTGAKPVCNLNTGACVANACENDDGCAGLYNSTGLLKKCSSKTCAVDTGACTAGNVETTCTEDVTPFCNLFTGGCVANECNVNEDCARLVDNKGGDSLKYCNQGKCTVKCTANTADAVCGTGKYCNIETGNCAIPFCTTQDKQCTDLKKQTGDQFKSCLFGSCSLKARCTSSSLTNCNENDVCRAGVCAANTCQTSAECRGVSDGADELTICHSETCKKEVACTAENATTVCAGLKDAYGNDLTACIDSKCGIPQGAACDDDKPCAADSTKPFCKSKFCAPCENDFSCAGALVCDKKKGLCYTPIDVSEDLDSLSEDASADEVEAAITSIASAIPENAPVSSAAQEAIEKATAGLASFAGAATTPAKAEAAIESIKSLSDKKSFATSESLDSLASATLAVASSVLANNTLELDSDAVTNLQGSLNNIVSSATSVFAEDTAVKEQQLKQASAAIASVMSAVGKKSSAASPATMEAENFKGKVARDTAENLTGKETCPGGADEGGCVNVAGGVADKLKGCSGSIEFLVLAKEFNEAASAAGDNDVSDKTQEMSFFCIGDDGSREPIAVDDLAAGSEITFTLTAATDKFVNANSCRYLDEDGTWSAEGVTGTVADDGKSVECKSTHLTNFTTFESDTKSTEEEEEKDSDEGSAFTTFFYPIAFLLAFLTF